MTRGQLFAFISQHRLAVLSTIGPEGEPQSALVGIAVTEELELIFDTLKSTRKYRNLIRNPASAFVIGCANEQTLQYEGWAVQPAGEELKRYKDVYFATWTDGPSRLSWPGICYFAMKPKWIRFSDYDQRPALIDEMRFNDFP